MMFHVSCSTAYMNIHMAVEFYLYSTQSLVSYTWPFDLVYNVNSFCHFQYMCSWLNVAHSCQYYAFSKFTGVPMVGIVRSWLCKLIIFCVLQVNVKMLNIYVFCQTFDKIVNYCHIEGHYIILFI